MLMPAARRRVQRALSPHHPPGVVYRVHVTVPEPVVLPVGDVAAVAAQLVASRARLRRMPRAEPVHPDAPLMSCTNREQALEHLSALAGAFPGCRVRIRRTTVWAGGVR